MTTRRGEVAPLEDDALRAAMVEYQQGQLEAFDRLYAGLAPLLRGYLLGAGAAASVIIERLRTGAARV